MKASDFCAVCDAGLNHPGYWRRRYICRNAVYCIETVEKVLTARDAEPEIGPLTFSQFTVWLNDEGELVGTSPNTGEQR